MNISLHHHRRNTFVKAIALLIILVGAATSQEFANTSWRVGSQEVTAVFGPAQPGPLVTGAPYTADEVQQPPSGSQMIGHIARDSQGRTRIERAHKSAPVRTIEIFDPVAGVAYLLDEQKKIAHRMPLPSTSAAPVAGRPGTPDTNVILTTQSTNGSSSTLTNMNHTEPDPALFKPPAGYRIIDETAPFPMTIPYHRL